MVKAAAADPLPTIGRLADGVKQHIQMLQLHLRLKALEAPDEPLSSCTELVMAAMEDYSPIRTLVMSQWLAERVLEALDGGEAVPLNRRFFKKLWVEKKYARAFMVLVLETARTLPHSTRAERLDYMTWYVIKAEEKYQRRRKQEEDARR